MNVLVVFYSRYGDAEALALAAGLGALQARGSIRLRRLAGAADARVDEDPAAREHLQRMNLDYVTPRPADPPWADVLILVAPRDSAGDLDAYIRRLPELGSMHGKVAATISADDRDEPRAALLAAAADAGLVVVPAPPGWEDRRDRALAHGKRATAIARALKQAEATA